MKLGALVAVGALGEIPAQFAEAVVATAKPPGAIAGLRAGFVRHPKEALRVHPAHMHPRKVVSPGAKVSPFPLCGAAHKNDLGIVWNIKPVPAGVYAKASSSPK